MVPSSRGGVPVFNRPSVKPARSNEAERPRARRFADSAGGPVVLAEMDQAAQKSAGRNDDRTTIKLAAVAKANAGDATGRNDQIVRLAFDHAEIGGLGNGSLHRRRVELAIRLGPRPSDRRTLAAVQHPKLDAAGVGDSAHQSVKGIDLPDQMALPKSANGGIAGHGPDGGETMGHQRRLRAHSGSRARGFTAGMTAADRDDVEFVHRGNHAATSIPESEKPEAGSSAKGALFHVKRRSPDRQRNCFT